MPPEVYYEEQKFNQPWIKILLFVISVGLTIISVIALLTHKANFALAIIPFIVGCIIFFLFSTLQLKTKITADEISYQFFPVHFSPRKISRKQITFIKVVIYDPIKTFGGWGIRYNGSNWAYTISGNVAIDIQFSNKKIFLGTQQPEQVKEFLQKNWNIVVK